MLQAPRIFDGAWRSPVAHLLWEQGALGSNPSAPIQAGVAQLVEQLICNQQVGGSSPFTSLSRYSQVGKAEDCKSFILGSNPSGDSGAVV